MTALPRATYKPVSKLWPLKFFCSYSLIWLTSGILHLSRPPIPPDSLVCCHQSTQGRPNLGSRCYQHTKGSCSSQASAYLPSSHPRASLFPSGSHRLQAAPNLGTQPPREPKARQQTLLKHTGQLQLINFSLLSIHPAKYLQDSACCSASSMDQQQLIFLFFTEVPSWCDAKLSFITDAACLMVTLCYSVSRYFGCEPLEDSFFRESPVCEVSELQDLLGVDDFVHSSSHINY